MWKLVITSACLVRVGLGQVAHIAEEQIQDSSSDRQGDFPARVESLRIFCSFAGLKKSPRQRGRFVGSAALARFLLVSKPASGWQVAGAGCCSKFPIINQRTVCSRICSVLQMEEIETQKNAASAVQAMRLWVERAVIGLHLCPWARPVHDAKQLHFCHTDAASAKDVFLAVHQEVQTMMSEDIESTIVVAPRAFPEDFQAFYKAVSAAEQYLHRRGLEDVIQLVSFHPMFTFAGEEAGDAYNYVNRSPHPAVHILRQDSVTDALENWAGPDITLTNQRHLRQLGVEKMVQLMHKARSDAEAK